jgi:serine/threonine protein kinase
MNPGRGKLANGTRLGRYEIVGLLGFGGMGDVYRATDTRLRRAVAIKVLPDEFAEDPDRLRRFEREARAAAALNHPHICTIYDVDEHEGTHFIAMELLEGRTLRQLIDEQPVDMEQVLTVAIGIADALDTAHRAGIVHRDITPMNIYITSRGDAKVLDFGLARVTTGATTPPLTITKFSEESMTRPGTALGTVAYMSPEQARGETVDGRTDLFSFGVVVHEMATGQLPFPGSTAAVIFDAVLNRQPAGLSRVHPKMRPVVSRALEKDRARRHPSAADLLAELRHIRHDTSPKTWAAWKPSSDRSQPAEEQSGFARTWTHHLYLKGRSAWSRHTAESITEALDFYQKAILSDPQYARAYAGMADCYSLLGFTPYATMAPAEAFPRARAAAEQALALDHSLAEAFRSRGQCKFLHEWDWSGAEADFRKSAELQSDGPSESQFSFGVLLAVLGRFEDAIVESRRACEANPLSVDAEANLAAVLYFSRRYDAAISTARNATRIDRTYEPTHFYLSLALQATGQVDEAIQFARNLRPHSHSRAHLGWLYGLGGRRAEAMAILDELRQLAQHTYVSPHSLALVHAGLGDAEGWTRTMQASVEERSGLLVFLKRAAWNDAMRKQPFYDELARRIGLP